MNNPSRKYIEYICALYNAYYDDRIENTAPPTAGGEARKAGADWKPGVTAANHKSLAAFQRELRDQGIKLSTSKIKKILVTGGRWSTETTRMVQELFRQYTEEEKTGEAQAVRRIAAELSISTVSVSVSLPYSSGVYNLPEPSSNAKRCRRYKERKTAARKEEAAQGWRLERTNREE